MYVYQCMYVCMASTCDSGVKTENYNRDRRSLSPNQNSKRARSFGHVLKSCAARQHKNLVLVAVICLRPRGKHQIRGIDIEVTDTCPKWKKENISYSL